MQLQREYELEDKVQSFSFRDITYHRLINRSNSRYEVLINWEDGSITWDPMSVMRCNDPVYLVKYAHDNNLIYNHGWKQLSQYVNHTKKMNHIIKAAKDKQQSNKVKIKFGVKIPCDHKEAMIFDADNGNTKWKDAELL